MAMVSRKKIHLAKVLSSLNLTFPECSYSIPPKEVTCLSNDLMLCPKCWKEFQAGLRGV